MATISHKINVFSDGSLAISEPAIGIPLPSGNIMQVKHDSEAMDDKFRVGFPEVFPLYLSKYCSLTEAWQWFWFRQLIHSYTGFQHWDEAKLTKTQLDTLKSKWRSLTKSSEAFTNFKGTDKYRDYISDRNVGTELPGQEPLTCCGNIVKVIGSPVRLGGEMVTLIETLDGNRPPPPIDKVNRLRTPHLIFCATNVAPIQLPDGRYKVDPFPQLAPKDTLVALRTNGKETITYNLDGVWLARNYIRTSRLKPISGNVVPSPYIP